MADFGENIRTIARTRELEEKIDIALRIARAAEKATINGKRAIAYGAINGATSIVSGEKNSTIPPGTSQAVEGAVSAAKKTIDDNAFNLDAEKAPGNESRGTDKSANAYPYGAGSTNAANLLDAVQNIVSGARDTARADLSAPDGQGGGIGGADKVTGVWARDWLTDSEFIMALDGMYRLPDGWTDPFTPPPVDGWELGYFWEQVPPFGGVPGSPTGIQYYLTLDAAKTDLIAMWAWGGSSRNPAIILDETPVYSLGILVSMQIRVQDPTGIYTVGIARGNCSTDPEGDLHGVCPLTPPEAVSSWPAVGNYILALTGGLWTPNIYDSEVPFHMQGTQSAVTFSMGGGRYGVMEAAIGGGQIMYEVSGTPPFIGDARISNAINTAVYFRPDGTIGHFIPSEQIIHWIPNTP